MDQISVYTTAYNAEDTIVRTLDSVLNQSYSNFIYFVTDNGSTDSTWNIIKDYTTKDKRIIATRCRHNFQGSFMKSIYAFFDSAVTDRIIGNENCADLIKKFQSSQWVSFIDADDTYEPDFLKEMLCFAQKNSLQLAVCGWDFVRPSSVDRRVAEKKQIIEKSSYAALLPKYDKFMGPVWNKLFSIDLFTNAENVNYFENKFATLHSDGVFFYGADSCFNYILLARIERFGLLDKSLCKYNILESSVTRKNFHPMRIVADRKLAECRFDFLEDIGCGVNKENREFILNIYMKSTMSTIDLLLNSDKELETKISNLREMFRSSYVDELFKKFQ